MAVGGVSGGSGFLQVNQMVSRIGEEKAAMYMERSKSHYEVSNFGNETKLGTSRFQRENDKVLNTGEQKTSMLTERGKAITDVSNFGNETKFGRSEFQRENKQVHSTGEQKTSMLSGRKPDEYIFQSRQKDAVTHKARPISRQRCYQIINGIAKKAGIEERIGCHTLRKTFGYHYYQTTGDVVSLQRILGHSFQRETLVYIGVVQENIDESMMKMTMLTGRPAR